MASIALSAGCSQAMQDDATKNDPKYMELSASQLSVQTGAIATITSSFRNGHDDPIDVHPTLLWLSSNPSVATVQATGANSDGKVTGVALGTATITATYGLLQQSVTVTVTGQPWAFDSTSGATTGSWQDAKGSASASLVFTPRDTVYEGENYNLIYKFIGTVMINDGFSGRPSASLSIGFGNRGLPAYSYDAPKPLGAMVPGTPLTDSISLSVTWPTIPVGATLVGVQMRGSISTGAPPNAALVVNAYYHKVTQ